LFASYANQLGKKLLQINDIKANKSILVFKLKTLDAIMGKDDNFIFAWCFQSCVLYKNYGRFADLQLIKKDFESIGFFWFFKILIQFLKLQVLFINWKLNQ